MLDRCIEGRADESGKCGISLIVVALHAEVDVFPVIAGVLVPGPCVDCVTLGLEAATLHRFAQREVGESSMRAQLDQGPGLQRVDEPKRKRRMLEPRRLRPDLFGYAKRGRGKTEPQYLRGLLIRKAGDG